MSTPVKDSRECECGLFGKDAMTCRSFTNRPHNGLTSPNRVSVVQYRLHEPHAHLPRQLVLILLNIRQQWKTHHASLHFVILRLVCHLRWHRVPTLGGARTRLKGRECETARRAGEVGTRIYRPGGSGSIRVGDRADRRGPVGITRRGAAGVSGRGLDREGSSGGVGVG